MTKALQDATDRHTCKVARAMREHSRHLPTIDPTAWYEVIDPNDLGFFVVQGGALRFHFWHHFEVREAPAPAVDGGE